MTTDLLDFDDLPNDPGWWGRMAAHLVTERNQLRAQVEELTRPVCPPFDVQLEGTERTLVILYAKLVTAMGPSVRRYLQEAGFDGSKVTLMGLSYCSSVGVFGVDETAWLDLKVARDPKGTIPAFQQKVVAAVIEAFRRHAQSGEVAQEPAWTMAEFLEAVGNAQTYDSIYVKPQDLIEDVLVAMQRLKHLPETPAPERKVLVRQAAQDAWDRLKA